MQGEDELASIGIVIGASWNGARAFTATSGPGISLMTEFIGLSYFAEVPAVIMNVQRAGPSTGMPTRTQQCDIIACAYASHGDTKHVLLFPEDPAEAFEFAAAAFDLAERLQTVIFVMLDLDIGMNHRLCRPLKWDDARQYDRGKIMTAEMLEEGRDFGRYLDVDGDGIPYRTYPGTHPTKGSYFTRGTSRDRYARYSEEGPVYADNMQRLVRKFETAQDMVPRPLQANAAKPTKYGVIYFGSTSPAMDEAIGLLEARGHQLDRLRIRAFPFHSSVASFIADHDFVYVVEQNRDSQLRSLIVNENGIDPVRLIPIVHYDGIADHRALHRQSHRRPSGPPQGDPAPQGRVMTYIAKPKFHHPGLQKNDLGFTHRDYEGKISTLCAGCGHDFDHGLDHRGLFRAVDRAAPGGEDFRHRLLLEDAGLFPRQFARLQFGAWPHAVGPDRRQSRQPRPDLSRRFRRRRFRLDRLRPVRAFDPARRQHDLYRREQRRLRPHQGPVLGDRRPRLEVQEGRDEHRQRHRPGGDRAAARRELRGAQLFRRQDASWCR